MNFKASDKIVCIDSSKIPKLTPNREEYADFCFPNGFLKKGVVYTVKETDYASDGIQRLKLVGLPIYLRNLETGWSATRFRKVVSSSLREKQEAKSRSCHDNSK